jgi:thiol-disulfide isomerase/thioredoxin
VQHRLPQPIRVHRLDRLPALSALALAAAVLACCGGREQPQISRVEGVKAGGQAPAPERWCDAFYTGAEAPSLALPRVAAARPGETIPVLNTDRWVWVNLWATWCGPCRREMPLVLRWHEQLGRDGIAADLWFLSVDAREQDLTRFLKENPGVAPGNSVRLAADSDLNRWLGGFPGAPTGSIPLQVIVAPGGKVRCIRAGALREGDYPLVKALFQR